MEPRDVFKLAEAVMIFAAIGGVLAWQWWTVRPATRQSGTAAGDRPEPAAEQGSGRAAREPWWMRGQDRDRTG